MLKHTFIFASFIIVLNTTTTMSTSSDGIEKPQKPQQALFNDINSHLTSALKHCKTGTEISDSIAIAFLDTLNGFGDRAYDLYNGDTSLHGGSATGISTDFQAALKNHALVSVISDGVRIFKGSPELVLEKFKPYLTDAGKGFFNTRMQDQLQPCLFDDQLVLLPWDTLIYRVQMWDRYCAKHKNSYAAREGKRYLKRYLSMFLPQKLNSNDNDYGINIGTRSDINDNLNKIKFGNKETANLIEAYLSTLVPTPEPDILKKYDSLVEAYHIPTAYFAPESTFNIKILEPLVSYGEEEVSGTEISKKRWIALVLDTVGHWRLEPVNLTFKKCAYDDGMEEEKTSNCINPPVKGTRYLLNGISISSGPVDVTFKGMRPKHIPLDSTKTITIRNRIYQLKSRDVGSCVWFVYLVHNGNSKYIIRESSCLEINTGLLWEGDLDRDGKLDLIVDSNLNYSFHEMRLLLSGSAKPGELLKWEAQTFSVGHYDETYPEGTEK